MLRRAFPLGRLFGKKTVHDRNYNESPIHRTQPRLRDVGNWKIHKK
jgi:hypothetical protein